MYGLRTNIRDWPKKYGIRRTRACSTLTSFDSHRLTSPILYSLHAMIKAGPMFSCAVSLKELTYHLGTDMEHEEERGGGREEEAKDKRRTNPGTERYA